MDKTTMGANIPAAEESVIEVGIPDSYNDNPEVNDTAFEREEDEEVRISKYSITSYGADMPVDSLVSRLRAKAIGVPSFQRQYVWSQKDASRFIESLLLGLPVPSIFLSKTAENQLLVIDGQQRLKSLQYFYDGVFEPNGKHFKLTGVQPEFEGRTYKNLGESDSRALDNSIIHAIIINQERPEEDDSSVYHVFERLNTGGKRLSAQEIRACLYHGDYIELLNQLNRNQDWRALMGSVNKYLNDQELLLRFLALHFDFPTYKKPMKEFLNTHLRRNKDLHKYSKEQISTLFSQTVNAIHERIGARAFKPEGQVVRGLADAVMFGIAQNLTKGTLIEDTLASYNLLRADAEFMKSCRHGTSDEATVTLRLGKASKAFGH